MTPNEETFNGIGLIVIYNIMSKFGYSGGMCIVHPNCFFPTFRTDIRLLSALDRFGFTPLFEQVVFVVQFIGFPFSRLLLKYPLCLQWHINQMISERTMQFGGFTGSKTLHALTVYIFRINLLM